MSGGSYTNVMGTLTSAECVMKHSQELQNLDINDKKPDEKKPNEKKLTADEKLDKIEEYYDDEDYDRLIRFYLIDIQLLKNILKDYYSFDYVIVHKKSDATEKNVKYLYLQRRNEFVEFIHERRVSKDSNRKIFKQTHEKIRDSTFIKAVKAQAKLERTTITTFP